MYLNLFYSNPQRLKKTRALWLTSSSDYHLPRVRDLVSALPNSNVVLEKHLLHLRCPPIITLIHLLSLVHQPVFKDACAAEATKSKLQSSQEIIASSWKVGYRSSCSWATSRGTRVWMQAVTSCLNTSQVWHSYLFSWKQQKDVWNHKLALRVKTVSSSLKWLLLFPCPLTLRVYLKVNTVSSF